MGVGLTRYPVPRVCWRLAHPFCVTVSCSKFAQYFGRNARGTMDSRPSPRQADRDVGIRRKRSLPIREGRVSDGSHPEIRIADRATLTHPENIPISLPPPPMKGAFLGSGSAGGGRLHPGWRPPSMDRQRVAGRRSSPVHREKKEPLRDPRPSDSIAS